MSARKQMHFIFLVKLMDEKKTVSIGQHNNWACPILLFVLNCVFTTANSINTVISTIEIT